MIRIFGKIDEIYLKLAKFWRTKICTLTVNCSLGSYSGKKVERVERVVRYQELMINLTLILKKRKKIIRGWREVNKKLVEARLVKREKLM